MRTSGSWYVSKGVSFFLSSSLSDFAKSRSSVRLFVRRPSDGGAFVRLSASDRFFGDRE